MLTNTPFIGATILPRRIAGQTIAKSDWSPRERAQLAAKWRLGRAQIAPTTRLAATVFGVSVPLVNAAIAEINTAPAPALTDSERAAIAHTLGEAKLWKLLAFVA